MRKIIVCALLLCLLWSFATAAEVDEQYALYEDLGKVLSVEKTEAGYLIEAEGYMGYHMDQNPSMTVQVEISEDGVILSARVVSAKDQTPGFDQMITQEYMDEQYAGKTADPNMEADAVTSASITSKAVVYAVRTAAYYAQNVLGCTADTSAAEKAELNAVFPAAYTTIESDYQPDTKKVGTVLYAADGETEDGRKVVALKVKGAARATQKGSARTGWDSAMPNPYTMIIVIDRAESKVIAWQMLVDGTRQPDYFAVPDEKIDAYKTVTITDETVFDEFMDGLMFELRMEYTTESSEDGPVITGTSIVYTGATEQGTFSSQIIRNCFRTAAAFYVNAAQ